MLEDAEQCKQLCSLVWLKGVLQTEMLHKTVEAILIINPFLFFNPVFGNVFSKVSQESLLKCYGDV